MPAKFNMELRLDGLDVADKYDDVAHAIGDASPVFRDISRLLELDEMDHFWRLRGRYVRSGDLMMSLTEETANQAIRDIHGDGQGLTFGTGWWYSVFLTKGRKESDDGQTQPANHRKKKGKSAVLVLRPMTKKHIVELMMGHITEGWGDGPSR